MIQLRCERIDRDWSLEYVAKKIGVTKTAIHNIETGKRQGSLGIWDALEDLFGIDQRTLRKQNTKKEQEKQ